MSTAQENRYKPRKLPTQPRADFTYNAILDAAAQVLCTQGYDKASTNRIAERAGVSIGSLYEYFPSKEAVFCALKNRCSEIEFQHVTQALLSATELPIKDLMRLLVKKGIEAVQLHPDILTALQNEVPTHIIREKSTSLFAEFFAVSFKYAAEHQVQLRKTDLDAAIWIGAHVPALLIGHTLVTEPERLSSQSFEDELYDLMSRYFLTD